MIKKNTERERHPLKFLISELQYVFNPGFHVLKDGPE